MNKIFQILVMTICLVSCDSSAIQSLTDGQNITNNTSQLDAISTGDSVLPEEKIKVYFDYPKLENEKVLSDIKQWGENIIKNFEQDIALASGEGELHGVFQIYESTDITTVHYDVNIYKSSNAHPENIQKMFYIKADGTSVPSNEIFPELSDRVFDDFFYTIKNTLKQKLGEQYTLTDSELKTILHKFISDPNIIFDNQDVYFVFGYYDLGARTLGKQTVHFDLSQISPYLNSDIFKSLPNNAAELSKVDNTARKITKKEGVKYVALSFDDGPNNTTTPRLLEILEQNGINATFFVLGKNAQNYPDVVKKAYQKGNEIAGHSWDHPDFTRLRAEGINSQVSRTDDVIKSITGKTPILFRPPYGSLNDSAIDIIGDRVHVLWNVDTLDWKNRNVDRNLEIALQQVQDGSIILFHDIYDTSVDTVQPLIDNLTNNGYEFVTVGELLTLENESLQSLIKKKCSSQYICRD